MCWRNVEIGPYIIKYGVFQNTGWDCCAKQNGFGERHRPPPSVFQQQKSMFNTCKMCRRRFNNSADWDGLQIPATVSQKTPSATHDASWKMEFYRREGHKTPRCSCSCNRREQKRKRAAATLRPSNLFHLVQKNIKQILFYLKNTTLACQTKDI